MGAPKPQTPPKKNRFDRFIDRQWDERPGVMASVSLALFGAGYWGWQARHEVIRALVANVSSVPARFALIALLFVLAWVALSIAIYAAGWGVRFGFIALWWVLKLAWRFRVVLVVVAGAIGLLYTGLEKPIALVWGAAGLAVYWVLNLVINLVARHFANQAAILRELQRQNAIREGRLPPEGGDSDPDDSESTW